MSFKWSTSSKTNSTQLNFTALMINPISPWVLLPNACSSTNILLYQGSRPKLCRSKKITVRTAMSSCNPDLSSTSPKLKISTRSTMSSKLSSKKWLKITKKMPMLPSLMLLKPKIMRIIIKIDFIIDFFKMSLPIRWNFE